MAAASEAASLGGWAGASRTVAIDGDAVTIVPFRRTWASCFASEIIDSPFALLATTDEMPAACVGVVDMLRGASRGSAHSRFRVGCLVSLGARGCVDF